ncbi:MAG: SufS family cysteine desulfurase [Bacteroidales bacterium]|nr:SufS family cysteine desulfurase [Bacteroidales bacterium]
MGLNIHQIRNDFPILRQQVYKKPLVYLDNGATTHKPKVVIDTIKDLQELHNSSIHRGIHYLSEQMTIRYEEARETVRDFINAASTSEIIFTSGATGSINAVAFSFGEKYVGEGDEILISEMEHHSNIVPWQMLCERKGAILKVIPFNNRGELMIETLDTLLTRRTRIIALTHASNSLGTITPVKEVIRRAHERDIPVLLDGAQMVQHGEVDVRELDCDFYVFSSHKIFGPTGSGVLYGKEAILEELPPYQGGGDMVEEVTFDGTTYNTLPFKFEAGTTNFMGAIGLASAIDYIRSVGIAEIKQYEEELIGYTLHKLKGIDGMTLFGTAKDRISVFSFLLDNIHPYDAGMILDKMGIAVRTGTHCTQPVMDHFGISGTIRASLVFYNTKEEVDMLIEGLERTKQMLT